MTAADEIPASLQAITIEQMAEALEVGESTVKRWIREQQLPALKFGGNITRILVTDAEQFVRAHRDAPAADNVQPIR